VQQQQGTKGIQIPLSLCTGSDQHFTHGVRLFITVRHLIKVLLHAPASCKDTTIPFSVFTESEQHFTHGVRPFPRHPAPIPAKH
jgi:hypothetical protein